MEEVPIAEGTDLKEVLKDWQDRLAMKRSLSGAGVVELGFVAAAAALNSQEGSKDEGSDGSAEDLSDELESSPSSDEGSDSKHQLPSDPDKAGNHVAQWENDGHAVLEVGHANEFGLASV
eukprot:gene12354-14591_t